MSETAEPCPTGLSSLDQATGTRGKDPGATPYGHQTGFKNRGKDIQPGVNAPIENAIVARGSDEGDTAAPLESEDAAANRGTDADAPQ